MTFHDWPLPQQTLYRMVERRINHLTKAVCHNPKLLDHLKNLSLRELLTTGFPTPTTNSQSSPLLITKEEGGGGGGEGGEGDAERTTTAAAADDDDDDVYSSSPPPGFEASEDSPMSKASGTSIYSDRSPANVPFRTINNIDLLGDLVYSTDDHKDEYKMVRKEEISRFGISIIDQEENDSFLQSDDAHVVEAISPDLPLRETNRSAGDTAGFPLHSSCEVIPSHVSLWNHSPLLGASQEADINEHEEGRRRPSGSASPHLVSLKKLKTTAQAGDVRPTLVNCENNLNLTLLDSHSPIITEESSLKEAALTMEYCSRVETQVAAVLESESDLSDPLPKSAAEDVSIKEVPSEDLCSPKNFFSNEELEDLNSQESGESSAQDEELLVNQVRPLDSKFTFSRSTNLDLGQLALEQLDPKSPEGEDSSDCPVDSICSHRKAVDLTELEEPEFSQPASSQTEHAPKSEDCLPRGEVPPNQNLSTMVDSQCSDPVKPPTDNLAPPESIPSPEADLDSLKFETLATVEPETSVEPKATVDPLLAVQLKATTELKETVDPISDSEAGVTDTVDLDDGNHLDILAVPRNVVEVDLTPSMEVTPIRQVPSIRTNLAISDSPISESLAQVDALTLKRDFPTAFEVPQIQGDQATSGNGFVSSTGIIEEPLTKISPSEPNGDQAASGSSDSDTGATEFHKDSGGGAIPGHLKCAAEPLNSRVSYRDFSAVQETRESIAQNQSASALVSKETGQSSHWNKALIVLVVIMTLWCVVEIPWCPVERSAQSDALSMGREDVQDSRHDMTEEHSAEIREDESEKYDPPIDENFTAERANIAGPDSNEGIVITEENHSARIEEDETQNYVLHIDENFTAERANAGPDTDEGDATTANHNARSEEEDTSDAQLDGASAGALYSFETMGEYDPERIIQEPFVHYISAESFDFPDVSS